HHVKRLVDEPKPVENHGHRCLSMRDHLVRRIRGDLLVDDLGELQLLAHARDKAQMVQVLALISRGKTEALRRIHRQLLGRSKPDHRKKLLTLPDPLPLFQIPLSQGAEGRKKVVIRLWNVIPCGTIRYNTGRSGGGLMSDKRLIVLTGDKGGVGKS